MDDMPDLTIDLETLAVEELLEYQQALTRARLEINDKARQTQAMIDRRAQEIAERRAQEDILLGQVMKPPPQELFG